MMQYARILTIQGMLFFEIYLKPENDVGFDMEADGGSMLFCRLEMFSAWIE